MTHLFKRFDIKTHADSDGDGHFDTYDEQIPDCQGEYVLAQDAIDREAVNAAKIATLEAQLKAVKRKLIEFKVLDMPEPPTDLIGPVD